MDWWERKPRREVEAVELWEHFHETLSVNNSKKIPAKLRGIFLKGQLYGRANDLVWGFEKVVIWSEILDAIFKRDKLSVVTEVNHDLTDLLSSKRKSNESFRNYEARFEEQFAKFHSHGKLNLKINVMVWKLRRRIKHFDFGANHVDE